eukprot:scaffold7467_cov187-Amphora_coffeaeformis.AAC.4
MSTTPSEKIALSSSLHGCTESSTVKPKSLPDVDDVSMSKVSSYIQQYREDVYWSFLSDTFFIAGGICYVLLAVPALNETPSVFQTILEFVAPIVYLLNSCVDVKWAQIAKERSRARNEMTETWSYWRIMLETETDSNNNTNNINADRNQQPWYIRLRKHAAHRRTSLAAWTFGIAAYFSVLAVVSPYCEALPLSEFWSDTADALSVLFYILSAVISVSGKRTRPWLSISPDENGLQWLDSPETLEDLGDILFLVGSIVDCVLCFATFDDDRPGWAMTSAILWLVDACLYLKSDFIQSRRMDGTDNSAFAGGTFV